MRSTTQTFTTTQPVTVQAVSEEIVQIEENKLSRSIMVSLAYKDADGQIIGRRSESILDTDYDNLMSESPDFAPGKPANEYREQDLFYVIDLIRTRS